MGNLIGTRTTEALDDGSCIEINHDGFGGTGTGIDGAIYNDKKGGGVTGR